MKRAYHDLLRKDKSVIHGPLVIEFDPEERIISWHPLLHEEHSTEWVGGTYIEQ